MKQTVRSTVLALLVVLAVGLTAAGCNESSKHYPEPQSSPLTFDTATFGTATWQ